MSRETIRVLIVDDHAIVREGYRALLAKHEGLKVVGEGFVTKSSPPDLLVRAVRDIAEGRLAICPEISEALAVDRVQEEKTGLHGLSPREFEIFRLILAAKSTDEIASAFNLSPKTVANYHYAIKSKLGVDSDIELLYFGLRQGLVEPVSSRK
jgi:DNA-binding NarL/FixJ family response regulator